MFRRRKRVPVAGEVGERCAMCGEVVPVGEDGRCDLGHRVRPPLSPPAPEPDPFDEGAPHTAATDATVPLEPGGATAGVVTPAALAAAMSDPDAGLDALLDMDWDAELPEPAGGFDGAEDATVELVEPVELVELVELVEVIEPEEVPDDEGARERHEAGAEDDDGDDLDLGSALDW